MKKSFLFAIIPVIVCSFGDDITSNLESTKTPTTPVLTTSSQVQITSVTSTSTTPPPRIVSTPPILHDITNQAKPASCSISWDRPESPNGIIERYEIEAMFTKPLYFHPTTNCSGYDSSVQRYSVNSNQTSFVIKNLLPFAFYQIRVKAFNEVGGSKFSGTKLCKTMPGTSEKVTSMKVETFTQQIDEPYNNSTLISWRLSCRSNSEILSFSINATRREGGQEPLSFNEKFVEGQENYTVERTDFLPDSHYDISIAAVSKGGAEGAIECLEAVIEAGLPSLEGFNISLVESSSNHATVSIPTAIFKSIYGVITEVLVLIKENECGNGTEEQSGFERLEIKSWANVQNESCTLQYEAASLNLTSDWSSSSESFNFTVGMDACGTESYCNGPLKPDTLYELTVRVFTKKGFSTCEPLMFRTEKEPVETLEPSRLRLILIVITSILCLGFVAVSCFILTRKTKVYNLSKQGKSIEELDIPLEELPRINQDSKFRKKREYEEIQAWSEKVNKSTSAAKMNRDLNRYANILPYNYNRVMLDENGTENDYINASYIKAKQYPRVYIAAQGPKSSTNNDFWRMVLQNKVESIVMLTSFAERVKIEYHNYFPKLNRSVTFDNVTVTCNSEDVHSTFIKRVMKVEKDNKKHQVKHYHFSSWPQNNIPKNKSSLIQFCKAVRHDRQKPDATMIVHSSAGVGRTGTFIAIDIVMERLEQGKTIEIFDLVKQLRLQRMKMVQTAEQYILLHRVRQYTARSQRSMLDKLISCISNDEEENED